MTSAEKQQRNETSTIQRFVANFEGHRLTTITYRGRQWWIAREVGVAVGYENGGKRFATKITGEWSDEFLDGTDYIVLTGAELADFKRAFELGTDSVPSRMPNILLLSESGLNLALVKTHKPIGKKLRRFIADEVLPQIARTGSYELPQQVSDTILQLQQTNGEMMVAITTLRGEVEKLNSRVANDVGVVTPEWVENNVRAPIERIVDLLAGVAVKGDAARAKARLAQRRSTNNLLRNIVCFNGKGSSWEQYPRDAQLIKILVRTLSTMLAEASGKVSAEIRAQAEEKARAEAETRLRQLGLFPSDKN